MYPYYIPVKYGKSIAEIQEKKLNLNELDNLKRR